MSQEKTIKEWFDYLPKDIKTKAIANIEPGRENWKAESLYDALDNSCFWSGTPEGDKYWGNIASNARKGKYNIKPIEEMGVKKKLIL